MKKWIKVSRGPNGPALATVTLVEGNLTSKYTSKVNGNLKGAVTEATRQAQDWLDQLKEIVDG